MNHMFGLYHEFDAAVDALELSFRMPYRDAALIDLEHVKLIAESQEILRKAKLVIVLTHGNGDYHDMQELLEGFTCRFVQKPITQRGWDRAMDPQGATSLIIPNQKDGNVLVMEGDPQELPTPKKRGRPKKS